MKYGKLNQEEFQKRCEEVFDTQEGEEYYDITVEDDGTVVIQCGETGTKEEGFAWVHFDYLPDMSERPEALSYLLGEKNSFND